VTAPDVGPGGPGPALTAAQAARILSAVGAGLEAGDGDRVTGPAAAWLTGASAGAPAQPVDGAAAVGVLHGAVVAAGEEVRRWPLLVPRTDAWPRSFAVRAPGPDGGSVIGVLVATDAREPYRLWAALPVLADAVEPGWPSAAQGAALVPVDAAEGSDGAGDSGGSDDPEGRGVPEVTAALTARFADVLAEGDVSAHAPEFAADTVSAAVRERLAVVEAAVTPAGVVSEHVPDAGPDGRPVLALQDAQGGGLVVTAVTTTARAAVRANRPGIPVPEDLVPAAGTASAPRGLEIVSTVAVLFAVPPERGNIGPLAAADGITSVTVS
jgi:hypothetical protein